MHVGETSGHHPKNKRRALQSRSEMCGEAAGLQRRKRTVQLERGSEGARERGRRRDRKRKSNLSAPQPHFYSNMRVKRRHSRSRPSLFLSLSLSLPLLSCASRFAPSITYSLSLPPALIAPRLISSPASPTVSITSRATGDGLKKKEGGTRKIPLLGPASRKTSAIKR